jgi:hypothetical protein
VELVPIAQEAMFGSHNNDGFVTTSFAMFCAWAGETDLALEQLEAVSKIPGGPSYGDLRLNPMWDPLRGDPRFEKIVASLAPKKTSPLSRTGRRNTQPLQLRQGSIQTGIVEFSEHAGTHSPRSGCSASQPSG